MSTRPEYVQSGPHEMPPPPYMHRNVRFLSFAVPSDLGRQADLCRAWFEGPGQGRIAYKPILPLTYLVMVEIESVTSMDPEFEKRGVMSERDIGLWIPVWRTRPPALLPRWFPIQLFVDKAEAAFAGREVYGFPKSLGRFAQPAPGQRHIETTVLRRFDPSERVDWAPIIELRPHSPSPAAMEQAAADQSWDVARGPERWKTLNAALSDLARHLLSHVRLEDDMPSERTFREGIASGLMPMAFLKQFLDVQSKDRACHQSIIESSPSVARFGGAGFTRDSYEVCITSYPSHAFDALLGIAPGWQRVGQGVWAEVDFIMPEGTVVHEST